MGSLAFVNTNTFLFASIALAFSYGESTDARRRLAPDDLCAAAVGLTLPTTGEVHSSCDEFKPLRLGVCITREQITVDGSREAIKLTDGRFSFTDLVKSSRGATCPALEDTLKISFSQIMDERAEEHERQGVVKYRIKTVDVDGMKEGETLTVEADRNTPFSTMRTIILTAEQAGFSRRCARVTGDWGTDTVGLPVIRNENESPKEASGLQLKLNIQVDGVLLSVASAYRLPDMEIVDDNPARASITIADDAKTTSLSGHLNRLKMNHREEFECGLGKVSDTFAENTR